MRQKIKQWLIEENLFREEIDDDATNFRFVFAYPEEHFMEIIQPSSKPDMIIVAVTTIVNPDHIEIMKHLPPPQRAEFIWAFRCILNNFFVDFELAHEDNVLERFSLSDILYEDGVSKDALMRTVRKVWKANLQAIWILQKEFVGSDTQKDQTEIPSSMYR